MPTETEPQRHDAIAVIDFGGQYAHLIATKVRRHEVLAEILQPEDPIERFTGYKGIILSGSPALSSLGEDSDYTKAIYDLDVPIIGFCFGHQEIAKHYGGEVVHGGREWGHADLQLRREHPLFAGLGPVERVWMSHFDSVEALGDGFEELGYTRLGAAGGEHRNAAIGSDALRRYGLQFHPEVDATEHGDQMIANFVKRICGCAPSWTMERYLDEQVARIREQVGDRSVFLLASGGVDSTVAARLFGLALGPQRLHLLHIDNGLMRHEESARVLQTLRELGLGDNLHFVDATDDFLAALQGEVEPERKRAAIGNTFIEVFEREARRLGIEDHLLGQGTIYPDTIETGGTKRADTIKTHHNRVPVIERMIAQGRVVEPLAELYKVEVRELGDRLGVPEAAVWRHPFPGPGLGVRLLCSRGEQPPALSAELAELGPAVQALAQRHDLCAVVLPVRSVGVKADVRSYEHPVLLAGDAPWERLLEAAGTILKGAPGINRCVWDLSPQPLPSTGALRPLAATMTRARLDLLREADRIVMEGRAGQELCVVRPIRSERAMTATAAPLPAALLEELRQQILPLPGICGLALDLTSKPPGTIEWE